MLTAQQRAQQQAIIEALQVKANINIALECQRREDFLVQYLQQSGCQAFVLGMSGGVDSLVAGYMAQAAAKKIRTMGGQAHFVALRLPYGQQQDEADAQQAVQCIQPDEVRTINIKQATDAVVAQLEQAGWQLPEKQRDFIIGNIKARERMIVQYACAASVSGIVLGSDQAAEALMGYFTKYGDGAADVMPLYGLTKSQVQEMAKAYGAPENLVYKTPTADLESERPLLPDEQAFGVSYQEIDAFLTGQSVSPQVFDIIVRHYQVSAHKRALPARP